MKRKDCTQNDMVIDGQKIATWYSEGVDAPYQAVNMTASLRMLKGYNLTDAEKTDLPMLMAGYCRLIEEAGFTGYGDYEIEAIQELFQKALTRGKVKPVSTEPDLFA
jgi:hypothetical protein